jgi:alcohol dehydrogenase (cytochrome c)
MASAWGLPGSYDPQRKLMYWGVANPRPHTRMKRHGGDPDGTARSAPADLYSNSTIALGLDGKLSWYYQHLPGDDWDSDFTHERMLLRTSINPDSNDVKWINPKAPRGQQRDVIVSVGEPGGLWVLDRDSGQFLWASPFPQDTPYFVVSKVDIETGKTYINWDQVIKGEGDKHIVCFQNTRTYPSIAYHPGNNSLYIPYTKLCTERAGAMKTENGATSKNIPMPGADPKTLAGIAKVNLSTGHVQQFYTAPETGTGAVLATAGDLIFYGDQNRRFRAFDSESGKILWETILAGAIENSTITYAIQGKQYVAVMTGDGSRSAPENQTAVYVFALP